MSCARHTVLSALEQLAPLGLAEPWDNVGLLIDPDGREGFDCAFVTIDLTEATLAEARQRGTDLIVAYHPPIFSGLKRLRRDAPRENIALCCAQESITVYSPHTALDAHQHGMTAWLAKALGPGEVSPIVPVEPGSAQGSGRHVVLERPVTLQEAVVLIKAHLGLSQLRLSRAFTDQMVTTFAVCPGAGGSVFEKLGHVDLLLTGEMRHHDVLSRKENGTHVILTDHTNTERGYLPHFADDLRRLCPGLRVEVSTTDADPLLPL